MNKDSKIYVAGSTGMVGSAIVRKLKEDGYTNIITSTRNDVDLLYRDEVQKFFLDNQPEYVFLCAAKVGGIEANSTYRADFIYDNLMIASNIIWTCHWMGVKKLINLGSSCIYPRDTYIPISETQLLSGYLEPTNQSYAIAKIAAVEMCFAYNDQHDTDYVSLMPTNLYGIGDTYDDKNSHVIPAMIQRFHNAKINGDDKVVVWGDGTPMREFLFADDLAEACVFVMNGNINWRIMNVGSDEEVTIEELAYIIKDVVGFDGDIVFDTSKPNGTPRKKLNTSRLESEGWKATTKMETGLKLAYTDYLLRGDTL